jgi:DNA-binding protein HU-beta
MNKTELIDAIAAEAGLSKVDSKKALDGFVKVVTKALAEGDKISLIGFGSFSVGEKAARMGINPSTRQTISIPAKKTVKFKAGSELADAVK